MEYSTKDAVLEKECGKNGGETNTIYRSYAPLVRAVGRECGVPESELDDLIQRVMSEFFRNSSSCCKSEEELRSKLCHISRMCSMDILRKLYREQRRRIELADNEEDAGEDMEDNRQMLLRTDVLKRLKERMGKEHYRQFCMLALQHRDARSVANIFKLSLSSVYANSNRAREMISEIISEVEPKEK